MKIYIKHLFITASFVLCFFSSSYSQLNDYAYKIGLQASYVSPQTYFTADGVSMQFRPFGRFELGQFFDIGVGVGYAWMSMKDDLGNPVKTTMIPFDARLLFSPVVSDSWNPYIYGGFGGVYWQNTERPINPIPSTDVDNDTDVYIPMGAGIEFALNGSLLLDVHAGWNYSWTEIMTGYNDPSKVPDKDSFVNDSWWTFGIGLAYSKDGCSKDSDGDGITDCDEEELGLNPEKSDTDSDGLSDGDEMNKYNTDPKNPDSDNDKLNDGEEVLTYSTNPLSADSDKDSLADFEEVITYKTDPLNPDTDGDTLSDGDEVNKYKTDPKISDTDGDTLTDPTEINETKTDPTKADTDADGLGDNQEINTFNTDPLNPDTDGEKLLDGEEVIQHNTDPHKVDTDGGGLDDFLEIQLNKDPLDPSDDVASIDLEIQFGFNSKTLSEVAVMKLYGILPKAKEILRETEASIEIQGHSDNSGSDAANQKISEARAKAVYDWLIANGLDQSRLRYKGYGKEKPRYSNSTQEGRDKNRRIEFFVDRGMK